MDSETRGGVVMTIIISLMLNIILAITISCKLGSIDWAETSWILVLLPLTLQIVMWVTVIGYSWILEVLYEKYPPSSEEKK